MQRLCSDEMYSHCTYKIIASGNSSHSEPANCPNFINSTRDPSSPCSNCLAWLLHHRLLGKASTVSLQGSCRHGPPSHTCRVLSTRGVTMLSKRQGSSQRTESHREGSSWSKLPGLLPCWAHSGLSWEQTQHSAQLLVLSHLWLPFNIGSESQRPGSKTGLIFHNSHLHNTRV